MKILISRKDLRDTTSGVPKKVLQELQFFNRLGHEAFAIAETLNVPMVKEFGGVPLKTFRWPISGFFRRKFYDQQVARWMKKNRPDIVIGHGDILNQDVLFIHNCVHLAHELIEGKTLPKDHEVGQIHEAIFKKGSFKLLICNSQMMKNDLVQRFNLEPSKVRVIHPEVNLKKFMVPNIEALREEWRGKFGFAKEDVVIGLVTSGNFKKRNLGLLIDAFKEVNKNNPKAKLFVAGGNIDEKYKTQAEGLSVVFAPSIIDVKNYYYLLDLFVLPAHIEEFGRSVLEAMFCSKPVVTTAKVGASEIMEGASRDFILEAPTLPELTKRLQDLVDSKPLRERIGSLNHETSTKYSADAQNELFGKTLEEYKIFKR